MKSGRKNKIMWWGHLSDHRVSHSDITEKVNQVWYLVIKLWYLVIKSIKYDIWLSNQSSLIFALFTQRSTTWLLQLIIVSFGYFCAVVLLGISIILNTTLQLLYISLVSWFPTSVFYDDFQLTTLINFPIPLA